MLSDLVPVLTASDFEPDMLHCWHCGQYKPRDEFGVRLGKSQSTCIACNRIYQREWYREAKSEGRR